MKITDEIFQVGGGRLTSYEDAAIYLISFNGHAAIVDAGCGDSQDKLLKNIRSCGVKPDQIEYLFITHCHYDHTGGAKALKDKLQCRIISHELDAPFLEQGDNRVTAASWYDSVIQSFTVDRKLSGAREKIDLGGRIIEAVHTPGHSPGSVVYLTESDGFRVVFAQDVHGPLDPSLLSDKADYRRSLELLLSLEADILCEGHFGVYRGKDEVKDFIESYI
ncbi:MBL fold metallo-hydrolase [Desulfococcaceae bacterium HSG8]|nr:MBL fold metallo-hydrolase [Desulfococcaceae bacterium HSG8]